MIHKHIIPKNISETTFNITSILINFKSFIRQVYQKHWTQDLNKEKDQNNYFRAEISQREEQLPRLKVKKKIDF